MSYFMEVDSIHAAQRRAFLAMADYRHAWDYGTKEEEAYAYQKAKEALASVRAHDIVQAYCRERGSYRLPAGAYETLREKAAYHLDDFRYPPKQKA